MDCPKCKQQVKENSKFCGFCGTKIINQIDDQEIRVTKILDDNEEIIEEDVDVETLEINQTQEGNINDSSPSNEAVITKSELNLNTKENTIFPNDIDDLKEIGISEIKDEQDSPEIILERTITENKLEPNEEPIISESDLVINIESSTQNERLNEEFVPSKENEGEILNNEMSSINEFIGSDNQNVNSENLASSQNGLEGTDSDGKVNNEIKGKINNQGKNSDEYFEIQNEENISIPGTQGESILETSESIRLKREASLESEIQGNKSTNIIANDKKTDKSPGDEEKIRISNEVELNDLKTYAENEKNGKNITNETIIVKPLLKTKFIIIPLIVITVLIIVGIFLFKNFQRNDSTELIKLEEVNWNKAIEYNNIKVYEEYLKMYPNGNYRIDANARIESLKEEEKFWSGIAESNKTEKYELYLKKYPEGKHVEEAKENIILIKNDRGAIKDKKREKELLEKTKEYDKVKVKIEPVNQENDNINNNLQNNGFEEKRATETNKDIPAKLEQKTEFKTEDKGSKVQEKDKKTDNQLINDNQIYDIVEIKPEFDGGNARMVQYIQKNINYPVFASENNVQGSVYLSFIVEKDGKLTDLKVIRGIGGGCDEEAVRIVKSMPKWKPGKNKGKIVRVRYSMPINFKLL